MAKRQLRYEGYSKFCILAMMSLLWAGFAFAAGQSGPAKRPDGSLPDIRGQATKPQDVGQQPGKETRPSDFMRILCPKCKYELNIRL